MRRIIPERYGRGILRALVVSNMLPDAAHPERGRFVRDQVAALRRLGDVEIELHEFAPSAGALARAALELHRRYGGKRPLSRSANAGAPFDVVHAHFGLTAWPALAVDARVRALTVHGTDVHHPRTRLLTAAVIPMMDVLGAVSSELAGELPGVSARRRAQVLPCGVDLGRFRPLARPQARVELGLDPARPYLLFPADPDRPEKRHDYAVALADAVGVELLTLGGVDPEQVPLWINAANAVLVPSEREGFGLAVLEALACDVPVLATPVGVHREVLASVAGTLCAPFDLSLWQAALEPHVHELDPRVAGRESATRFSDEEMAACVAAAWRTALQQSN
jgi:teichuronic acid biosynthesis glycosyltransferase TuaC